VRRTVALLCALVAAVVVWQLTVGSNPPAPPTLADFWSGKATWRFDRKWTSAALGQGSVGNGAVMKIANDRWYLFNRRTYPEVCADGFVKMGIQVRESDDRGRSWSPPVTAVAPTAGTEWSCDATDGDVVYDEATQRWRLLFQCQDDSPADEDGGWNGCYVERAGADPMGAFSPRPGDANPVIRSGDLWSQICDPGDECADAAGGPGHVHEEGTFDIFRKDASGWWVAFHGTDGRLGFRGIARTPDFTRGSFRVDDDAAGLPTDAVLGPSDARGFREQWSDGGPVGAGAGSIVEERGYAYLLAEFPDRSLACTAGQSWDLGIFRSSRLASSTWEPYPLGNPIVYSSRRPQANGEAVPCNVTYPNLFEDPATGVRYMLYGRSSGDPAVDGLYLYRLVWQRNALTNGDFWPADAGGWTPVGGSQLVVQRDPNASLDGTPFLELSCGAPQCQPASAVVQDQPVRDGLRDSVTFGGEVRAMAGTGSLELVLRQLDATGKELTADVLTANAGPEWKRYTRQSRIDDRARTLRFELRPLTPGPFGIDNLAVEPAD
jgi:hypothetical protein